ncbi:MAG: ankyrin repeat domain-containing protein, partial [Candidatus Babeliales bacterium]
DARFVATRYYNYTALHFACEKGELDGNVKNVELLLNHGADPNARTLQGNTPLHLLIYMMPSSVSRRLQYIDMLLASGGDINARGEGGKTFLHELVHAKDFGFIKLLRKRYRSLLDLSVKNDAGLTAKELAESFRYDDVVKALS